MWIKVIEEENVLNKTDQEPDDITTEVSQNNSFMIAVMVFLSVTVVIVINFSILILVMTVYIVF